MITVKDVLDKGIEFVADDVVAGVTGLFPQAAGDYAILAPNIVNTSTNLGFMHPECIVKKFAQRENEGAQPASDDVLVDITFFDGLEPITETHKACDVDFSEDLNMTWTPSLKNWEQDMNDQQEIKVGLTCSDELDEIAKECVSHYTKDWDGEGLPPVGFECEFKELSAKVICFTEWSKCKILAYNKPFDGSPLQIVIRDDNGDAAIIYESECPKFRKPETPEQKAKRERLEAVRAMFDLYGDVEWDDMCRIERAIYAHCEALYDKGYRLGGKQHD